MSRFTPFLLVLILTGSAFASDYHSPRTAGMGGAGHAGPLLNDGIYLNPAIIALLPAYSVSVSHESASGPDNTEPQGMLQNVSIQDGTNTFFAAGVGYTRKTLGKEVNVGVASRLFQNYGAGIGAKFLFGSDSKESAQDAILSVIGGPLEWLQAGVIVDNLMETTKTKQWNQFREFTLGLKADVQKIMIFYFDPHVIPNKSGETMGYEAGVEMPVMSDLYLRAGLNKNSFQPILGAYGHGHGFGFGWTFPRMSLDVAMTRTFEPARTNNFLFSVTIL